MINLSAPVLGIWRKIEYDKEGNVVEDVVLRNLVTDAGRTQLISNLLALTASAGVIALCVGACTTAAQVTDTRLTYELIGNATRKTLTNTSGAALSPSDIVTYSGGTSIVLNATSTATFYQSITAQATYNSGDGNNGNQFGEYGLNTSITLPGAPTNTSGVLFNHLIDPSPTFKNSSNSITLQISLYF